MTEPEVLRLEVAGGQSIVLDWYPAHARAPVVLYIHGLGSDRRGEKARYFARQFSAAGRALAALDLRGHGDSDGELRELTMSGLLADVDVAAAWTAARSATGRLLLIGASMGASVAAWYAARRPALTEALILIAPAMRFPAALAATPAGETAERWRSEGELRVRSEWIDVTLGRALLDDAARYDPDVLPLELRTPALLIHGFHDSVIPWEQSADFVRACARWRAGAPPATDLILISDGDHRLTAHKELLFALMCAWLERRAPATAGATQPLRG
jgi:pimeloyl-ACP methyl ester carboxylesterase